MTVMVSYSSSNRAVADELVATLRAADIKIWIDHEGIRRGTKWRDELRKQVRDCEVCMPIISQEFLASHNCRMELLIARSFGRRILPVMIEDCWDALDAHEATRGLTGLFIMRLYDPASVGLPLTRAEALERIVRAAAGSARSKEKPVYISYLNRNAKLATEVARSLEAQGVPAWVATLDTEIGDNWRQVQVRALSSAAGHLVILNTDITKGTMLQTELLLSEALGLEVFTAHHPTVMGNNEKVRAINNELLADPNTAYRRLEAPHAFHLSTSDPVVPADMLEMLREERDSRLS